MTKTEMINNILLIKPKLMKYRGRLYSSSKENLINALNKLEEDADMSNYKECKKEIYDGEKLVGEYKLINNNLLNVFKLFGNMLVSKDRLNEVLKVISVIKFSETLEDVEITDYHDLVGKNMELVNKCVQELNNDLKNISGYSKISYRKIINNEKNRLYDDGESPCVIIEGCNKCSYIHQEEI